MDDAGLHRDQSAGVDRHAATFRSPAAFLASASARLHRRYANPVRRAMNELRDIKETLDPIIESGAPGFTKCLSDHSGHQNQSKP